MDSHFSFCDKLKDYETITSADGILSHAKKLKAQGRTRFIGVSTHSVDIAMRAISSGEFDVLMFPINPAFDVLDDEKKYNEDMLGNLWDKASSYNTGGKGGGLPRKGVYNECERNGVALVAMKPFAGGFVFNAEKDAGFTPINLISYALSQTGLSAAVPGCENAGQIKDILRYYDCSDEERDYSGAVARSRWSVKGQCLYCNHCLPCPANINIGQVGRFLSIRENEKSGGRTAVHDDYAALPVRASACLRCGKCEPRCPFDVQVIKMMEKAQSVF